MLPGLDLYYADPAQPPTTASEEPDDLDHDLSDLSVRGVKYSASAKQRCQETGLSGRVKVSFGFNVPALV